ncbi:hypothetical protein Tco_0100771, partial [Tanacetum coccineum]
GLKVEKPVLLCDSQSALSLTKNPEYHERTNYIDVRLNFIGDVLEEDMFSIQKIATEHNPAHMLTKALLTEKFEHYLNLVNIHWRCQEGSCDMVCIGSDDPKTYKEVMASKDAENWIIAINEEMQSLEKNKTWDLVTQPKGVNQVGCKWFLKRKEGIPGVEPASETQNYSGSFSNGGCI